jgi:hypothetical protein
MLTPVSAAAAEAAARQLAADTAYLCHLGSGLLVVHALQVAAAVTVHLLCVVLPAPGQRAARLTAGGVVAASAAAAGARVFDPAYCALGAAGAGTLLAFNTPLRCAQLLATPVRAPVRLPARRGAARRAGKCDAGEGDFAAEKPATLSPLALVVLLVTVPACPLLPELAEALPPSGRRRRAPEAVAPVPRVALAMACFAGASSAVLLAPRRIVETSAFLMLLATTFTSGFANFSASLFSLVSRVPVSAPFSWPWLSPSASSFWAWRWNSPIASALRGGVYDPLTAYAGASPPLATLACFAASGGAHVAILWFAGVPSVAWARWFAFFAAHGVVVCAERAAAKAGLLSPAARRGAGVVFFAFTAHHLFLAPILESTSLDALLYELSTCARVAASAATVARRALASR